jgi:hypothetical protein
MVYMLYRHQYSDSEELHIYATNVTRLSENPLLLNYVIQNFILTLLIHKTVTPQFIWHVF